MPRYAAQVVPPSDVFKGPIRDVLEADGKWCEGCLLEFAVRFEKSSVLLFSTEFPVMR